MTPGASGPVLATLVLLLAGGCGAWSGSGPGCRPLAEPAALPEPLDESSGVAASRTRPGVFWTLNDGSEGVVYAVDAEGTLLDSIRPDTHARDWEDLALAPCPGGDCLWIADTGDNYGERTQAAIYRFAEPAEGEAPGPVESFIFRYPEGAPDVEALFVLPDGSLYLISKGTGTPPTLYRYPMPLRPDSSVTLEVVQTLDSETRALPRQITGAAASADGRIVAVRTYETVTFMAFGDDGLRSLEDGTVDLRTLREPQGEAVAFTGEGGIVLTSEAGPLGRRGSIVVLRCPLPEPSEG